jgi:hypothetical protein
LAISDGAVRSVMIKRRNGILGVEKFGEMPIPPGIISDGQIMDSKKVSDILREMKEKHCLEYVKVSLPEEKAYLFTLQLSGVSPSDVRDAIEFKLEENVPLPATEITFAFVVLGKSPEGNLNTVVSALPKEVVAAYVDTVKMAGLSILSLEIESQAVASALLPKHYKGTTLVAHFDGGTLSLYVVFERVVVFTSSLQVGKSSDDNFAETVAGEIGKVIGYWQSMDHASHFGGNNIIDRVIIIGDNTSGDIVKIIKNRDKIPVEIGNVWTNVCDPNISVPPISFNDSLKYAPAIGLALPTNRLL